MFVNRLSRVLSKRSVHASSGTASFASNLPREDRDFAVTLSSGLSVLGVIDGHCGSRVAEIVSKDLPKLIAGKLEASEEGNREISELLKKSYLELDAEILEYAKKVQHSLIKEGACVLSAVVGKERVTVANAGDSGALMVMKDASWHWLNNFHNAGNPTEKARLAKEHPGEEDVVQCFRASRSVHSPMTGGQLESVCYTKGMLQPTRAIGDFYLKEKEFEPADVCKFNPPYLSAEPEIFSVPRAPEMAFLVLATDGLWEMLGASEVAKLVVMHQDLGKAELARTILQACLTRAGLPSLEVLDKDAGRYSYRRQVDDITISVVDLRTN